MSLRKTQDSEMERIPTRRTQSCGEADVWTRMQGRARKSVWCLGLKPRKHQRARHDFSVGLLAPLQAEVHWQRRSNASMQPLRTVHPILHDRPISTLCRIKPIAAKSAFLAQISIAEFILINSQLHKIHRVPYKWQSYRLQAVASVPGLSK